MSMSPPQIKQSPRSLVSRSGMLALLAAVSLCALATTSGCKSAAQQRSFTEAYEQRAFSEAIDKASPIAKDKGNPQAELAALIAGMSAHALRRHSQAETLLTPLQFSNDAQVAARAKATLGLIARDRGQHAKAADLLRASGRNLDGDDAARAKILAGDSYKKLGQDAKARAQYRQAATDASDPALRSRANKQAKPVAYVVQAGAFATRQAATKEAQSIQRRCIIAGQPLPTITPIATPDGRTLFSVQIGPYSTQADAATALRSMVLPNAKITTRELN